MKIKQILSKQAVLPVALILIGTGVATTAFAFSPFTTENLTPEQQEALMMTHLSQNKGDKPN